MTQTFRRFVLLSYFEGFLYALMVASSESFALYIAVLRGLSSIEIAMASTLPLLIGAVAQWFIPRRLKDHSLRSAIIIAMLVQSFGIAGLYVFATHKANFWLLLSSLTMYWIGGLVASPLWLDWKAQHFECDHFRTFISKRSGFISLCTVICFLAIAYAFNVRQGLDVGLIFVIGLIARFICAGVQWYVSYVMVLPQFRRSESEPIPQLGGADPRASRDAILRLLPVFFLWTGVFKFAVYVSSPFFLPYMIHDLNFNIWDCSLVSGMSILGRSLFTGFWGRRSLGIMPFFVLQFTGIFISFSPLFWSFSGRLGYLTSLEFISGIFWAGFDLSCILIIQNFVSSAPRRHLGVHMAIMNSCAVLGSLLGGVLLKAHFEYTTLFAFSAFVRLFVVIAFIALLARWPFVRLTIRSFAHIGRRAGFYGSNQLK